MSLSRPTAKKFSKQMCSAVGIVAALLGFAASSALAAPTPPTVAAPAAPAPPEAKVPPAKPAPAKVNAELAVCPGQTFSQPFEAFKDNNYYTLVEGSEFAEGSESWQLSGGAHVVSEGPVGSSGHSLELPPGAEAVSPPVCVTLQYPTARVWVQNVNGGGGLAVSLAYAGTKTEEKPQNVGQVHSDHNEWQLANPINMQPQIAGPNEGVRQVRIHFTAPNGNNEYRIYGLYVDPRMS
jgi:hypothetical protein